MLAASLVLILAPTQVVAAVFDNYVASRNLRFTETPVVGSTIAANPNFLIDESRISGVGLNQAVLITQRHYITANHASTATPRFRGLDGVVRDYASTGGGERIRDRNGVDTDVSLFTLVEAISPSEVQALPVFTGFGGDVLGREIIVKGSGNQFGRNVIDNVVNARFASGSPTDVIQWTYNTTESGTGGLGDDEIGLVGGDSGSPVLIEMNGTLGVIGANFGIFGTRTAANPDGVVPSASSAPYLNYASFLSSYIDEIDEITLSQGGFRAARLTVTAVPEPSSIALLVLVGGAVAGRRRAKRKSMCA